MADIWGADGNRVGCLSDNKICSGHLLKKVEVAKLKPVVPQVLLSVLEKTDNYGPKLLQYKWKWHSYMIKVGRIRTIAFCNLQHFQHWGN